MKEEKKVVEVVEVEPTELEEKIEWQRARIKTRTPVTLERLQAWLQAKIDAKAAAESSKLGNAKAQLQHGKKAHGLTGRDLFSVDPTLFVDDGAPPALPLRLLLKSVPSPPQRVQQTLSMIRVVRSRGKRGQA